MKIQIVDKPWWIVALWSTAAIVISLAISVLAAIAISDFQWQLFPLIMKVWWLAFLVIIVIVDAIVVLNTLFPLQTISITLLAIAFVFMLASVQNTRGQELRTIISKQVDLDYLVASITVFAFFIAFITIYKTRSSK